MASVAAAPQGCKGEMRGECWMLSNPRHSSLSDFQLQSKQIALENKLEQISHCASSIDVRLCWFVLGWVWAGDSCQKKQGNHAVLISVWLRDYISIGCNGSIYGGPLGSKGVVGNSAFVQQLLANDEWSSVKSMWFCQ